MDELDLRASDEERDRTVAELRRHLVDGRLTMEEFDQRADQALRARTRRDLVATTAELPHLPDPGQARALRRAERSAAAAATLAALLPAAVVVAVVGAAWLSGAWWLLWLIWPALALTRGGRHHGHGRRGYRVL